MTTSTQRIATGLFAALCLLPMTASADQFQWLQPDKAEKAQVAIAEVGVIRHLCHPCGDTISRAEGVESVEISPIPDGDGHWEVLINGEAVDLAYVYVPQDGAWRNLALLLQLDASDVPATLARGHLRGDQKGLD